MISLTTAALQTSSRVASAYADDAAHDGLARMALVPRVLEALERFGYAPSREAPGLTVAYHSACSMQHGQGIRTEPKNLLKTAGFTV